MKNFTFILVFLTAMIPEILYSQNYYVTDIFEVQNDLTARTNPRKDPSGNDCALLKINVPSVKQMSFEGNVGEVKYLPGEFDVYVAEGTNSIEYSTQDSGETAAINFSEFGISIIGKTVYKVVLRTASSVAPNTGSVSIAANLSGAIVLIDGVPSGQIPVTVNGLSAGEHTISIPNTIGYTCPDKKVLVNKGAVSNVVLTLEETAFIYPDLEIAGSDNDGNPHFVRTKTIEDKGKLGLADLSGTVLVPCEFDRIYLDLLSGFYVVTRNGKDGLYKPGVGLIADCIYDDITARDKEISEWLMAKKGNAWGFINREGTEILPFIFTSGTEQSTKDNTARIVASVGSLTGVFDASGNVVVEPRPAVQYDYHEGMSVGSYRDGQKRLFFIMDYYGNEISLPEVTGVNEYALRFEHGLLPVQNSEKKWGYINKSGKIVIPYQYEYAGGFDDGFGYVELNGEYFYIDINGRIIAAKSQVHDYLSTTDNKHCYLRVTDGIKYGLMDETGKLQIPIKYESIWLDNSCNYFQAVLDGERFVFDADCRYLFTLPDNLRIWDSDNGIILIEDHESDTYGFINEKGDILGDCIYTLHDPSGQFNFVADLDGISEGMAMLVIGDRFGFMDNTGIVTVPVVYSAAVPFENGVTFVRKQDGTWLKIDKYNNIL